MEQTSNAPQTSATSLHRALTVALATTLEDLHTRIAAAVSGVDAADYDRPFISGAETIRQVVAAVAKEEYHWIGEILAGLPANTIGAEAHAVDDDPPPHPLFQLGSSGQFSQAILASLPATAWEQTYSIGDRRQLAIECVLHVIGELGRALGKIETMAESARR